jgi:CheY-like chemotaxis protein
MNQTRHSLQPALLMFIDDSDADIDIVIHSFEKERIRFDYEHYRTAEDAIARLEDEKLPQPDIIFVDRFLAGRLTGDDIVQYIRQANRLKFIDSKLVVLSGIELSASDMKKFTELDVDTFLPKPLQVLAVESMVKNSKDYYFQIMRQLIKAA